MLSDLEMWSALVGALMPPLIAIVNQSHWSKAWRGIISVASCVVAAAVTCWLRGDLSAGNYAHSVLVILTAALGSYHVFWRPSSIAPAIEVATSK